MKLIKAGLIVENKKLKFANILIDKGKIVEIYHKNIPGKILRNAEIIYANGKLVLPGIIDTHVHFREPGLTHKADIYSESKAAIAGGVTSIIDMPNTIPQTINIKLLHEKFALAKQKCLTNYSFYFGATNENLDEILILNPAEVPGIKIFLSSSTANTQVDNINTLKKIFKFSPVKILVHAENEQIIKQNLEKYIKHYCNRIPVKFHPDIRSEQACIEATQLAVELTKKYNAQLHILHLSTQKEIDYLQKYKTKNITTEVCVHHLWFNSNDYQKFGSKIKCNPSIKGREHQQALIQALKNNIIDVVSSDHAPHTLPEKEEHIDNILAPSGIPMVQHTLLAMLELVHKNIISLDTVIEKMCHAPARIFGIKQRGYIKKNYWADLTIVDINCKPWKVTKENILYKCKWSPFQDYSFHSKITHTLVNGNLVYFNNNPVLMDIGLFNENIKSMPLKFSS